MAVSIKSAREIELMREAGKRLAHVHQELEAMIAPGISTWEIDAKGEKLIRDDRFSGNTAQPPLRTVPVSGNF